ncbi:hypothetical protein [Nocardia pseudobrasiliensis]|uniref:Uncharacterized protein n=1 Tax=Nocardia pseudobrasiliensis TaxID=45979 RepID=A0A370I192_9NOCA|nr:hypothetical protein [Nocardia pseudobrasiliensis]RDI63951.1 hypothetical protein DFR76_109291 [Nocardia pseudobrasiliensis]
MTVEPLVIEFRSVPEELARVRGLLWTWLTSTAADPTHGRPDARIRRHSAAAACR